jgi:hypothetical protein
MNIDASSAPLSPLARVRHIAGLMRALALLGGGLFSAAALAVWTSPALIETMALHQLGLAPDRITITPLVQLAGALVAALPLALGIYGLVQVWRLFGEYAQGRVFTLEACTCLRRLAWSLIAAAAAQVAARTLLGLVLTLNNPPGKRMLLIHLTSNDYAFLVFGVLLLGIAWVMVEAARLAQEHAEFV